MSTLIEQTSNLDPGQHAPSKKTRLSVWHPKKRFTTHLYRTRATTTSHENMHSSAPNSRNAAARMRSWNKTLAMALNSMTRWLNLSVYKMMRVYIYMRLIYTYVYITVIITVRIYNVQLFYMAEMHKTFFNLEVSLATVLRRHEG